jgi:uncharacterized protein (TIGR01777 family)
MRVVVSGSSGLVGQALVADLERNGHEVVRLLRGRSSTSGSGVADWDPAGGWLDPALLAGADAVVNLCGRNIGEKRWTRQVKEELRASRIRPTDLIVRTLARLDDPPPLLVNASAVGYYGDRGEELLDETSAAGIGFLAELAEAWEASARAAASAGTRVVLLRLGMVVARGGALARMLPPFRLGLGGPIGSGRQWWPWISLDDVVAAVRFLLARPGLDGPLNLVAPGEMRCREVAATLGRALRRPALTPLPAVAVRALLGEMGEALLLASARVHPVALLAAGYRFVAPTLEPALQRALTGLERGPRLRL